jgi:hypothetical protein
LHPQVEQFLCADAGGVKDFEDGAIPATFRRAGG